MTARRQPTFHSSARGLTSAQHLDFLGPRPIRLDDPRLFPPRLGLFPEFPLVGGELGVVLVEHFHNLWDAILDLAVGVFVQRRCNVGGKG
jgi:hypothetical protein